MRILHVLDHSLPYFSGYSFRSDYILRTQQWLGMQPAVITSPKHEDFASEQETADGIDYYRTRWPQFSRVQNLPLARQMACVAVLAKEVKRLAAELKVDVIHAHSPSLNGLAAAQAAKALNLPWVYELRYYEEDAAVDRGKTHHNSLRYRLSQRLEQSAIEQADCVTTLSSALREDLIGRGIPPEKIIEIPNGVDIVHFQPSEPDAELIAKYNLTGKFVLGFIGSFYSYEGLEVLIDAAVEILAKRGDVVVLLAGEGEAEAMLKERIPDRLRPHFIFAGKVPHREAPRYYSVMDIAVYPRKRSRLTDLTTPLKPLEALAMGRVVVGSDVGGHRELFGYGEAGFLVEAGNSNALAARLLSLMENEAERRAMAQRGREFVLLDRDWETVVSRYIEIYKKLTGEKNGTTAR